MRLRGLRRSRTAELGRSMWRDTGFGSAMFEANNSSSIMASSSCMPLTAHILSPGLMGRGSPAPVQVFRASQMFHCETGVASQSPLSTLVTERSAASCFISKPKRVHGRSAARGFARAPGSDNSATKHCVVLTSSPRARSKRTCAGDPSLGREDRRVETGEDRTVEAGEFTMAP